MTYVQVTPPHLCLILFVRSKSLRLAYSHSRHKHQEVGTEAPTGSTLRVEYHVAVKEWNHLQVTLLDENKRDAEKYTQQEIIHEGCVCVVSKKHVSIHSLGGHVFACKKEREGVEVCSPEGRWWICRVRSWGPG